MDATMTRKTDSSPAQTRAAASIRQYRSQIDKLDLLILKMLNQRAALAGKIGGLKTDLKAEVFSPAREEEVLQHVLHSSKGPLAPSTGS
jgi:chorismate mutase/prephenate dehydratase